MKRKISCLNLVLFVALLIQFNTGLGQCIQQNIRASGYLQGECNGFQFQGIIGSISSSYGECGGLFFDTPLSGNDITSSVIDPKPSSNINIYPNPTTGSMIIESSSNPIEHVDIYSSIGQLLISKKVEFEIKTQFSLEDLHNGCYFIKVTESNSNSKVLKIIKI
ncbi:MAG TPA: T9SS type A sorting domain-containing protein [Saprospiraceae bacterium]|nr:T9SS type A sorting domain-containing protein [Saprospiraceae bacterium]